MNLDLERIENILVEWLKGKVKEAGSKGTVVGLSGGIDSAVTSVLCKKAFGERVLGVILPCYSNKEDEEDAKLVAEKFKIEYIQKDLGPVFDEFILTLDRKGDIKNNDMAVFVVEGLGNLIFPYLNDLGLEELRPVIEEMQD